MAVEVLYPNGYGATGGPGKPAPLSVIKARTDWKLLDVEFARRVEALMVHSGGTLGFGGGARSTAGQEALFRSRYHIDDVNGTIFYDGHMWTKNPGVASAAPPGSSYHEDKATPGGAVAADMVGDLNVLAVDGTKFGLIEFANVNSEPWHTQPLELPHARRDYVAATMYPLAPWTFPTSPAPPPAKEDDMQLDICRLTNTVPATDFLGYCRTKVQPDGGVSYQFWDVLWIDGLDPQAMKMYNDQIQYGGAQVREFGEHVAASLWLLNGKLPTSTHSDGRPWAVTDFGKVGS